MREKQREYYIQSLEEVLESEWTKIRHEACFTEDAIEDLLELLKEEQERLTDDDFETIRIHLNAYKENLCNQQRWEEAEEYQRIIDRFMAFASAQPEPKKGKWIEHEWAEEVEGYLISNYECSCCHTWERKNSDYCPNCGADMRGEQE